MTTGWLPDQVRALSGEDYRHLVALYNVEPWGPERDNAHAAMQLTQVANMNRGRGQPPVDMSRFILTKKPKAKTDAKRIVAFRASIQQSRKEKQNEPDC